MPLRVVLEQDREIAPRDLVPGATYLIRQRGNKLKHAVYLRMDKLYRDFGFTRKYCRPVWVFRLSSSGEEVFLSHGRILRSIVREVTGLEGIIAAGDIDFEE